MVFSMLRRRRGSPREPVSMKLKPEIVTLVDEHKEREGRPSRSNMLEVLIAEALTARAAAKKER